VPKQRAIAFIPLSADNCTRNIHNKSPRNAINKNTNTDQTTASANKQFHGFNAGRVGMGVGAFIVYILQSQGWLGQDFPFFYGMSKRVAGMLWGFRRNPKSCLGLLCPGGNPPAVSIAQ
jgi:hypothetical protein